jgi:hypothetical protein
MIENNERLIDLLSGGQLYSTHAKEKAEKAAEKQAKQDYKESKQQSQAAKQQIQ